MERYLLLNTIGSYLEVLKPRATILLTFIAVCAVIVAADGRPEVPLTLRVALVVLLMSGGANGLTNYLDRGVDARMQRTRHRAIPSRRIYPPVKGLIFTGLLTVSGLVLSWYLHPYCFMAGIAGVAASTAWRKRATCIFPQGR